MANSRLERIGTIYSRITGLLRAGALKSEDKPIWYKIYQAFPPKYQPLFDRPAPKDEVRKIFYKDDKIRAMIHKNHPEIVGITNLNDQNYQSNTQKCIDMYNKRVQSDEVDEYVLKQVVEQVAASRQFQSEVSPVYKKSASQESLVEQFKQAQSQKVKLENIFKDN